MRKLSRPSLLLPRCGSLARLLKLSTNVKELVASKRRHRRSRLKRETAVADSSCSISAMDSSSTRSMLSQKRWLVSWELLIPSRRGSTVLSYHSPILALLHGETHQIGRAHV